MPKINELLEYAGYDAIAIGNNETFNGYDTLVNMATKSKVPFLSCNFNKLGNTDIEGVKKSIILLKNNLRILIIGTWGTVHISSKSSIAI